MSGPLRTADFFALEAGECLDRLSVLASRADAPAGDELVRAARALRGSALMAGQQPVARAAAALEAFARACRDGRRPWDAATREQAGQAVEDFRLLVRQSRQWTDADSARAGRLTQQLETLAGRDTADAGWVVRASSRAELNSGVRAFVAREGALIASALDRAASALRAAPDDREPLYTVLRRMQSLRGLAELAELSPLPEILDGLELAVGDLTRLYAPPPGVDGVLDAGAQALTRVSRDVADQGRPTADADEARRFTDLLLRAFAAEPDVVPIESLYAEGDPEPMRRGAGRPVFAPPAPLGPLELVSHGEHLVQVSDVVRQARSLVERDLRLYGLVASLRSLAANDGSPLGAALAAFATAAREQIAGGAAARDVERFAATLRESGELLRSLAESGDTGRLAARLRDLAERIGGAATSTAAGPVAPAEALEQQVVPIESLAYDGESVAAVPVADATSPPSAEVEGVAIGPAAVVPIESLAPAGEEPIVADGDRLAASFERYSRLLAERGLGAASLDELLGRAGVQAARPAADVDVLDVRELCYSGRRALERAVEVRALLAGRLGAGADLGSVRPLLDELLDLLPLALDEAR